MSRKSLMMVFILVYLVTMTVAVKGAAVSSMAEGTGGKGETGEAGNSSGGRSSLTAMCLESSLPCMDVVVAGEKDTGESDLTTAGTEDQSAAEVTTTEKTVAQSSAPQVLIYHTHATESYLPATAGNYHTTKEENTVRDVGDVLAEELEARGIGVVHDKTLHDNPSYDNSYSRSFETLKALLEKYPTITCVIDLHRDATAGKVDGPVQQVDGKTAAVYSYVLSNTTDTYEENKAFLEKLNAAAAKHDGYTGEILERPYWYNQELMGKSILLEMGNNRNNIEDVRNCAKIYAEILAEVLTA